MQHFLGTFDYTAQGIAVVFYTNVTLIIIYEQVVRYCVFDIQYYGSCLN